MESFERLDALTEALLKLIQKQPITLSEISFAFNFPPDRFSNQLVELFLMGFIVYSRVGLNFSDGVLLNEKITITVKGSSYLESVMRQEKEKRTTFKLQFATLVIAVLSLIVTIIMLLQMTGWLHLEKL